MKTLLEARTLSKSFGPLKALQDVSFKVERGEIHAVVGENGAGKSTLMNILSGMLQPDQGEILVEGAPVQFRSRSDSKQSGIEMVHQHFMLVPNFTVGENMQLAALANSREFALSDANIARTVQASAALGWPLQSEERTRNLSVGAQQRLEIANCIGRDASILILDEPTAVLTPREAEELFSVLRHLKSGGKAIILIAHKLAEIFAIADIVTVLCHGQVQMTKLTGETSREEVARAMIGDAVAPIQLASPTLGESVVHADGVEILPTQHTPLDFTIRGGEVFGIGGVDGNGQIEIAETLAAIRNPLKGSLTLPDRGRIGYIPQDRQSDGLALDLSIEENMLIGPDIRHSLAAGPFLRWSAVREWSESLITKFAIKATSARAVVRSLSGGNQQKVVVARAVERAPQLVIAVNPTRGLDFRATSFVQQQLAEMAESGAAVVLITTDLEELVQLSHRIKYLRHGSFVDSLEESIR